MKSLKQLSQLMAAVAAASGVAIVGWQYSSDLGVRSAEAQASVNVTIEPGSTGKGPQAYGQNPLQVDVGTTVQWTNNDSAPHTVTSDAGEELKSGTLQTGQTFEHTFNTAGTYPYHCEIHGQASMSGVVQVGSATGATSSPTPSGSPSPTPVATPSGLTALPSGY